MHTQTQSVLKKYCAKRPVKAWQILNVFCFVFVFLYMLFSLSLPHNLDLYAAGLYKMNTVEQCLRVSVRLVLSALIKTTFFFIVFIFLLSLEGVQGRYYCLTEELLGGKNKCQQQLSWSKHVAAVTLLIFDWIERALWFLTTLFSIYE